MSPPETNHGWFFSSRKDINCKEHWGFKSTGSETCAECIRRRELMREALSAGVTHFLCMFECPHDSVIEGAKEMCPSCYLEVEIRNKRHELGLTDEHGNPTPLEESR